jgi:uncharacterized integral membrane protein
MSLVPYHVLLVTLSALYAVGEALAVVNAYMAYRMRHPVDVFLFGVLLGVVAVVHVLTPKIFNRRRS